MNKMSVILLAIVLVSVLAVSGCSNPATPTIVSPTPVISSAPTTTAATSPTTTVAATTTAVTSPTTTAAPTTTVATSPTPTAAIDAAQLYSLNCARCHGADRLGVPGHLLTISAMANSPMPAIIYIINHGHGSDMPGFTNLLTPEQINALANYLKPTAP